MITSATPSFLTTQATNATGTNVVTADSTVPTVSTLPAQVFEETTRRRQTMAIVFIMLLLAALLYFGRKS